jgi:hypothetical protein
MLYEEPVSIKKFVLDTVSCKKNRRPGLTVLPSAGVATKGASEDPTPAITPAKIPQEWPGCRTAVAPRPASFPLLATESLVAVLDVKLAQWRLDLVLLLLLLSPLLLLFSTFLDSRR